MTHAMLKGSNVPLDATAVRAVLRWTPGHGRPGRRRLGAAARPRRPGALRRGLRLLQPAPAPLRAWSGGSAKKRVAEGLTDTDRDRSGRRSSPASDQVVLAASADGVTFDRVRDLRMLLYDAARRRRRAAGVLRRQAGDRRGDRADLRRAVPARRRLEVPRAGPGLLHRPGRAGHRLRHLGGRVGGGRRRRIRAGPPPAARRRRPARAAGLRHPPPAPAAGPCPRSPPTATRSPPRRPASPRTATRSRPPRRPAAYGYPQPRRRSPRTATRSRCGARPDPDFALPPQGPQFLGR